MSLSIASRSVGDITVLTCTGRIVEGDEATTLESYVKKLLPWQPYIVVDAGGVTFVDSCGLGLLLRLRTLARTAAGDLKLCAANHRVRDVLDGAAFQRYPDDFAVSHRLADRGGLDRRTRSPRAQARLRPYRC